MLHKFKITFLIFIIFFLNCYSDNTTYCYENNTTEEFIAKHNRIGNEESSCVWVTLTSLCLHNKVEAGYKLFPRYKHGAVEERILTVLINNKILFYYNRHSVIRSQRNIDKGIKLIKYACDKKYYCAVGIPGHMLLCVKYVEDVGVYMIDNTGKYEGIVRLWSVNKFNKVFDGNVVVIPPQNRVI